MPANSLIRWPILTTLRDTVYVAANVFPIYGTAAGERPIYLTRLPGGPIPAPPGNFQFVYPKIIAAPNGDVHLVWAEFDSARHDVLEWFHLQTTLWHAVFAQGQWSTPTVILRAAALQWTEDDGHLAIDGSGALHAVVWVFENRVGVRHLRRDAAAWHAQSIPYGSSRYDTAVQAFGDSVIVALVGDSFEASDTTGVTVLRSTDRGATWPTSVVVRKLGARIASHPQFFRIGTKTLLVWSESAPRVFGLDTIRVVRLDDSLRPVPVASVPLPPGSSTFSATITPCGDLSILVATLSLSPRTFDVTVADNGAVSQQSLFPPHQIATFSGVGATSRAVVAVLAIRPEPGTPGRAVAMTRPACSARW